jgi:HAD superfamily hydrolase (TIGR01549 family)
MIQVIAFDAFGTLCRITDARNPYGQLFHCLGADKAAARKLALTEPLDFAQLASVLCPDLALVASTVPGLSLDLISELSSIEPFGEAVDTLAKLKAGGFRVAIVSNLAQPYTPTVLRLFDGLCDSFIFSCAVRAAKPQPQIFKALCESLNVSPQQVLMVGDNKRNDYDGALAFGMNAVHLDRLGGNHSVPAMADLSGVFQHLGV